MKYDTYAFICTRDKAPTVTRNNLTHYLSRAGVRTKLLVGQDSMFSGYKKAFELTQPKADDTIILCHDDIEILSDIHIFHNELERHLSQVKSGFAGIAGTTLLGEDAVWWDHHRWKQGLHKGHVFHGKDLHSYDNTYYGKPGQVVVMDGLFLAAKAKTLTAIGLDKPDYFEGKWDYYDIFYTLKAHNLGLINKTVPIIVLHNSFGELAGRESWQKNREAFINNHTLPVSCN